MRSPPCPTTISLVAAFALSLGIPGAACAAALPGTNWVIDPARTHIAFSIDAVGYPRTEGQFHRFEGHIAIDFDHPERSRVDFQVEAQSVDVGSDGFNLYLRSDALLDSARFETIAFTSKAVRKIDERHVAVDGELTMLGVTRPLRVDVAVERERARLGFTARAKIDRLDFGMNSGFPIVSRDIDLTVESEAVEH